MLQLLAQDVCMNECMIFTLIVFYVGTVIAAGKSLYLVPDVNAFRARSSSPGGKQGLQVQGPLSTSLTGGSVTLTDASGGTLDTASA